MKALREMGTVPRFLTLYLAQMALVAALFFLSRMVAGEFVAQQKWELILSLLARGQTFFLPAATLLSWALEPRETTLPTRGER